MNPTKAYIEGKNGELSGFVVLQYETDTYYIEFNGYFDMDTKSEIPVLESECILNESKCETTEYPASIQDHAQKTFDKYVSEVVRGTDIFTGIKGKDDGWTP